MSGDSWIASRTYRTHNHPSRFWQTSVLCPIAGPVATSHSDSEEGSRHLARLIAAAPDLYEALVALRSFMWAEGYADQNLPMAQADEAIAKAEATNGN